jgi:hypothetical protein
MLMNLSPEFDKALEQLSEAMGLDPEKVKVNAQRLVTALQGRLEPVPTDEKVAETNEQVLSRRRRVRRVATIITDLWPHRQSFRAAELVDDMYAAEMKKAYVQSLRDAANYAEKHNQGLDSSDLEGKRNEFVVNWLRARANRLEEASGA